jgi:hypothetical protein
MTYVKNENSAMPLPRKVISGICYAAYLTLPISAYLFGSFHSEWMGKPVTLLNLLRWDTNLAKVAPRRPKVVLRRRQKRGAR